MSEKISCSIIIPHKNESVLLQRCLDSIPQTDDIEIIIIDDNSDVELVDFNNFPGLERANTQVVFLKETESKGAGNARNIGLSKAQGNWLLFCDADDYFTNSFYTTLKKYLISDYDLVIFNIDIPKGVYYQGSVYQNLIENYDEQTPSSLDDVKYKVWTPWAKLYNANFIAKTGLQFESRHVGNDCFFVISANSMANKIKVDKEKIYHHYYNNNGLSHKKKQPYQLFLERMEVTIWRTNLYKQKKFYHYLEGAGIYQVLKEAYSNYGLSIFFKAFTKAIIHGADFIYPLEFKLKKVMKR